MGMSVPEDCELLSKKKICHHCVGEAYLNTEIQFYGKSGVCSYCGRTDQSYTIEKLSERIETAFEQHYRRTYDQPNSWQRSLLADRESDYEWEREGQPVKYAIEGAAQIPEQAADDVLAVLSDKHFDFDNSAMGEEDEFDQDSYYEEVDQSDRKWQEEWASFERSLKTESRFFSRNAAEHLSSLFTNVDKINTASGKSLVINAGPETLLVSVFRARVFQSEDKLVEALCRPDMHLGPPPSRFAMAGRMNAAGISVFYGATERDVAISEVRPPVGSKVVVARFNITRKLRMLDLTALSDVIEKGSIFDPEFAERLERVTFLRSLCQRIIKPVMPTDEAFEYLPTQAIADFLATENTPELDGIVYPSVQVAGDGLNVVLFHKSSCVQALEIPEGTEIAASTGYMTEDGWEEYYSVRETVTHNKAQEGGSKEEDISNFLCQHDYDERDTSLQIDVNSLQVREVNKVQIGCTVHDVPRYREKRWEDSPEF